LKMFKYPLEVIGLQTIMMPHLAGILCVQVQRGVPCLWALVEPGAVGEPRTIVTVGTGRPEFDDDRLHYIGTYQLHDGHFVGHVFERR